MGAAARAAATLAVGHPPRAAAQPTIVRGLSPCASRALRPSRARFERARGAEPLLPLL
jgi:hypothetical protein